MVWLTSSLIEMITFGLLIYVNDGLVRSRVTIWSFFEKIQVSEMCQLGLTRSERKSYDNVGFCNTNIAAFGVPAWFSVIS